MSTSFVYRCYKEWRDGQEVLAIEASEKGLELKSGRGYFLVDRRGSYERRFLLHEEDLKVQFRRWMRKHLRNLTVELAWKYLNNKLLKKVNKETLLAHRISLPICRDTAHTWMKKVGAGRMDTKKTYYNDRHQDSVVIKHRNVYINTLKKLQKRMKVWKVLSESEEEKYLKTRDWSPLKDIMPISEKVNVDSKVLYVHHIDDQEGWYKDAQLHPLFKPGKKPSIQDWRCEFKHAFEVCKCHLELREYGQDESVYNSGDNPSSRWEVICN